MDAGPVIVIAIRLAVPLLILRFPFWGTVSTLLVDALDVVLLDIISLGFFPAYHSVDKLLDLYYLAIAAATSLSWEPLAKQTSLGLFLYRLVGVVLFEATQIRVALFIFPNLFENWFLFWAARNRYFPEFTLSVKRLITVLILLLIPKLGQEYLLHIAEAQPWAWIKQILGILQ